MTGSNPQPAGTADKRLGKTMRLRREFLGYSTIAGLARATGLFDRAGTYSGIEFAKYERNVRAKTFRDIDHTYGWAPGTARSVREGRANLHGAIEAPVPAYLLNGQEKETRSPEPEPEPEPVQANTDDDAERNAAAVRHADRAITVAKDRELAVDAAAFSIAQALAVLPGDAHDLAIQRGRHYLAIANGLVGR